MMNTTGRNVNILLHLMNMIWMVILNSLNFTEYRKQLNQTTNNNTEIRAVKDTTYRMVKTKSDNKVNQQYFS